MIIAFLTFAMAIGFKKTADRKFSEDYENIIESSQFDALEEKRSEEEFINKGAIQCGFCTPGFIMSAKALLDENNNPTPEQVREAIGGNICRCTGYVKIEEAVLSAAERIRKGE